MEPRKKVMSNLKGNMIVYLYEMWDLALVADEAAQNARLEGKEKAAQAHTWDRNVILDRCDEVICKLAEETFLHRKRE